MSKPKPPRTEPAIRVVMMPRDTNGEGTIFGGVILSYIDQAGYVEARRQAPHTYVTVMMNRVEFKQPVYVGDVLSLYAQANSIGRTSIRIHVEVMAERQAERGPPVPVTEADLVYVALDENRQPTPIALA